MAAVSGERWKRAQVAEKQYWDNTDQVEFARTAYEKVQAVKWVTEVFPQLDRIGGPFVEIGIGPLGVGCIHLLPVSDGAQLVGVDPLPLMECTNIPYPFRSIVEACRHNYHHIQAVGENTGLPDDLCGLAALYNVLDHNRDPGTTLRELHRILRPGGFILLGCDVVSVLSQMKFHLYIKEKYANSIGVMAHPFRFQAGDFSDLVTSAGFEICAANRRRCAYLRHLVGRSHRMLILGRKR